MMGCSFPPLRDGRTILHLVLTLVMVWWVLILALPHPVFAIAPTFYWFAHHWPYTQHGWAVCMAVSGAVGFAGLIARNRWVRLNSITVLGVAHGTIASLQFESDLGAHTLTPGPGVYTILAAASVWRIWAETLR